MNFSSLVSSPLIQLVVDTSVLVNLHACTFGKQILAALPNKKLVTQIAVEELSPGTDERGFLDDLVKANLIELALLTDPEYELYEKLITTLDDGESATIALAITRQVFPFIDERKGRARACSIQPSLEPGWSLDLFRHPEVLVQLGSPLDTDALFLALKEGRMRIPEDRTDEVISLIGTQRAVECVCLPGYKKRFLNATPNQ